MKKRILITCATMLAGLTFCGAGVIKRDYPNGIPSDARPQGYETYYEVKDKIAFEDYKTDMAEMLTVEYGSLTEAPVDTPAATPTPTPAPTATPTPEPVKVSEPVRIGTAGDAVRDTGSADPLSGVTLSYSGRYNVSDTPLTSTKGVVRFNGHKETYYSQKILPGTGLNIPGRHVADDGTVRDGDGYIVVASDLSYLPRYSTVLTSLGPGKVYDTGCAYGTIDIYVNW